MSIQLARSIDTWRNIIWLMVMVLTTSLQCRKIVKVLFDLVLWQVLYNTVRRTLDYFEQQLNYLIDLIQIYFITGSVVNYKHDDCLCSEFIPLQLEHGFIYKVWAIKFIHVLATNVVPTSLDGILMIKLLNMTCYCRDWSR